MDKKLRLSKRLMACASFVREGVSFADIGTDHGYLPIWLVMNNRVNSAIAADIAEGPLNSAKRNSEKYGVTLKTILSDGLESVEGDAFDDLVIAGMGGGLICQIIDKAPYLRNKHKHLILQPMTAVPELRAYLYNNGFSIDSEICLIDENKIYSVMSVYFTDKVDNTEDYEIYMGAIEPKSQFSKEYAEKVIKKMLNKHKGLVHTKQELEAEKLMSTVNKIKELTYE